MSKSANDLEGTLLVRQIEAEHKARQILSGAPSPLPRIFLNILVLVVVALGVWNDQSISIWLRILIGFAVITSVGLSVELYQINRRVSALITLARARSAN